MRCRVWPKRWWRSVRFFSSRRRHTRSTRDWSSDVCSSDLTHIGILDLRKFAIKHIQAMIKVEQALEEAAESERQYKLLNLRMIDRESLSPAAECALEGRKEGGEELKKRGTIIGTPDEEIVDEYVNRLTKLRDKTEKPH